MRPCIAPHCGQLASSKYSRHCDLHKARLRRHGDPEQRGVTKAELAPYAQLVRQKIADNENNAAWGKLDARWSALVGEARGIAAARLSGRAGVSWGVSAAHEIVRLSRKVTPRDVLVTVTAMVLMQETEARRFKSDRAFRTQVVRRVRGLTEANATEHLDRTTNRVRRTYSELAPRASAVMADWLLDTFGIGSVHIARKVREDREEKARARAGLQADLEGLK